MKMSVNDRADATIVGPVWDQLEAHILNIKFETVWQKTTRVSADCDDTVSLIDNNCLLLCWVSDSSVGETRSSLNEKDLLLEYSYCHPGYTHLLPIKPSLWLQSVKRRQDDTLCLKQLHFKTEQRPSSFTRRFLSFRCKWPVIATEWLKRERLQGWPPEPIMSRIEETACRVVPFSHPFSAEKDIEWMFCFGLAEQILAREAASGIQRSCFQLFWLLVEYCLGKGSKIGYSHLKSVFFYTCEKIDQHTWDTNPARCILEMIHLLTESLESRFLPCYFIKCNNIMDDFHESDFLCYTSRLKTLEKHTLSYLYFMLDNKGQIIGNLHTVFDKLIVDLQCYINHQDQNKSTDECFLPCIVEHILLYASSKQYNKMFDIAMEATKELDVTFGYNITLQDLLFRVIQALPLEKGWICAFFVDHKLQLCLKDRVCASLKTVSLLDYFGADILNFLEYADDDIKVPEECVRLEDIATFATDFTDILKDELSLGIEVYIKAWTFFLRMHANELFDYIRREDPIQYPDKRQITLLQLENALMRLQLAIRDANNSKLVDKIQELNLLQERCKMFNKD